MTKGGKTKSTRLVESGEVAKSLCYRMMRAIFSSQAWKTKSTIRFKLLEFGFKFGL